MIDQLSFFWPQFTLKQGVGSGVLVKCHEKFWKSEENVWESKKRV
jgi:hypothetical protein